MAKRLPFFELFIEKRELSFPESLANAGLFFSLLRQISEVSKIQNPFSTEGR